MFELYTYYDLQMDEVIISYSINIIHSNITCILFSFKRIFPVYGFLIATYTFILPYLNNGPYWRSIIYRESERCHSNWWTNVLFINNYVHTDELVQKKKSIPNLSNLFIGYCLISSPD